MIGLEGVWYALCQRCGFPIWWQDCPTGGWWIHTAHPHDNHDALAECPPGAYNDAGEWITIEPID